MIIIVIFAALVILLFALQFQISMDNPRVPCIFEITNVRHLSEEGIMNEDSYVVLQNTDTKAYENWNLYAFTFVNGKQIVADLPTLNSDELIHTVNRRGVQYIQGGYGSRRDHDAFWYPQWSIGIDYSDHTIHPGDSVTIEIYNKTTCQLISRDTFPHTDTKTRELMDEYFNRLNA
jgi:hypothetical protein